MKLNLNCNKQTRTNSFWFVSLVENVLEVLKRRKPQMVTSNNYLWIVRSIPKLVCDMQSRKSIDFNRKTYKFVRSATDQLLHLWQMEKEGMNERTQSKNRTLYDMKSLFSSILFLWVKKLDLKSSHFHTFHTLRFAKKLVQSGIQLQKC